MAESTKRLWTAAESEARVSNGSRTSARHILRPWLLDVVSFVAAVALLVALVVLLNHYDDKPSPEWNGVTLNFLVSVLAQAIRAAIAIPIADCLGQLKWYWFWKRSKPRSVMDFQAYDNASRGPWGAFTMLCKPRMWHAASLGAILLIATLATEPFLQQMPTYPIRLIDGSKAATVNIASTYEDSVWAPGVNQNEVYVLNESAKGAFYSGVYNASSALRTEPTCQTGNCSWTPYSTLGFCSACSNIRPLLKESINSQDYDGQGYIWAAPNKASFDSNLDLMVTTTSMATIDFEALQNYSIVDITSMYVEGSSVANSAVRPYAYECILYFCIQNYEALVEAGEFHETLLSSFPDSTTSAEAAIQGLALPPEPPSTEHVGEEVLIPGYSLNLHPQGDVSFEGTRNITAVYTITHPADKRAYSISAATVTLLREFVQSMLGDLVINEAVASDVPSDMEQLFSNSQLAGGGPAQFMEQLAMGLSTRARNIGNLTEPGFTKVSKIYVYVRWRWIALPVVVLVLTECFVITTIIINAVREVPMWRCGSLPSLLYPLDSDTAAIISAEGAYLSRMEELAEKYDMTMVLDEEWRLQGLKRA